MLREITLGQYYPADSVLHSLDPRVKLFGTLVYLICTFIFDEPATLLLLVTGLVLVIVISKVPFRYMVRGLRGVLFLMIVTSALNLFFSGGEEIFSFYFIHITDTGVEVTVKMILRLTCLVIGTSILTLTTTPTELTDALDTSFHPLTKIGFPVHELALMMSIALRFIPILVEETDKIMKAQAARGASFGEGKLMERAKALVPILVPLFVSAFRRASDLALAMEARCYRGSEGRTKMKPLEYHAKDYLAYGIIIVYLVLFIFLRKR